MKLINRNRAIKDQDFASFLSTWQNIGKPDDEILEEGHYFDETINEMRFFTQTELDKNYQKEIDDFKQLIDEKPKVESKVYATIVIDSPGNLDDIKYFTDVVVDLIELKSLSMIFIPLFKTNWFNDIEIKNHHQIVKKAYKQLKIFIGKDDYSDGLLISSKKDFKSFLPIYFNLIGANYIPYGFFYSEQLNTVLSYHHGGELWFYCLSKKGLKHIEDFIDSKNLIKNKIYTTYNTI